MNSSGKSKLQRLLVTGAVSGALLACGGGSDRAPPVENGNEAALTASQPGELLSYTKARLRTRQAQRLATPDVMLPSGGAPGLAAAASPSGGAVLRSGTTVQEPGVDEDDLIKSDGSFIYTLDNHVDTSTGQPRPRLNAHRRLADGDIEATATLELATEAGAYSVTHGIQLAPAARRLAVLRESVTVSSLPLPCGPAVDCIAPMLTMPAITSSALQVQLVEAGSGGTLVKGDLISVSGRLVGTRLIDNTLYVVSVHSPQLAVEALPASATEAQREALLAQLTTRDLLPSVSTNGATPEPLVTDTDCHVQAKNASLGLEITTITAFDLGSAGAARRSRCIVGGSEALYMSTRSLVLATTRWSYTPAGGAALWRYPAQISTDLHKFALEPAGVTYRGSGSVAGHLGWDAQRKPYRISEHNGDLRVLSFTGELGWGVWADASSTPASPATLTVLRERPADQSLQVLATLPNAARPAPLGHAGEQVYAVRFLGERAYVVTFRQSDPLYVLDLADPADPKVVGELQVSGFSDALFPLANGLLFGVGKQASDAGMVGGVKVALFDVQDPAKPRELAVQIFGDRGSMSGLDYSSHGLNLLAVGDVTRIALPLFVQTPPPSTPQRGLQRFEVDTRARTLTLKPMIPAVAVPAGAGYWTYDLWGERSLQIGDKVYYLSQGQLGAWNW